MGSVNLEYKRHHHIFIVFVVTCLPKSQARSWFNKFRRLGGGQLYVPCCDPLLCLVADSPRFFVSVLGRASRYSLAYTRAHSLTNRCIAYVCFRCVTMHLFACYRLASSLAA